MTSALRKLIAFVFLGGMFWFAYRDTDNLWDDSMQRSLAVLTVAFALMWLFVPLLVVRLRSRSRVRRNREAHAAWRAALPAEGPRPLDYAGGRVRLEPGEQAFAIEKGTLYLTPGTPLDAVSVAGRAGEVAFPGHREFRRKVQRVRCCLTDRRIVFVGKALEVEWKLAEPFSEQVAPGGIVFERQDADRTVRFAFTFQNPLVTADLLAWARTRGSRGK